MRHYQYSFLPLKFTIGLLKEISIPKRHQIVDALQLSVGFRLIKSTPAYRNVFLKKMKENFKILSNLFLSLVIPFFFFFNIGQSMKLATHVSILPTQKQAIKWRRRKNMEMIRTTATNRNNSINKSQNQHLVIDGDFLRFFSLPHLLQITY